VRPTSERLVGSSLNSVFLVYFILACMPVRREEHSRLIFSYICFPGFVILVLLSRYFTDLHNYLNCLKPASKGFAIISRHVCFLQLFPIFRRKEGCEETFISCLLVEYFSVFKKTISRKSKIIENTSSRLKRDLFSRNIFWVFFFNQIFHNKKHKSHLMLLLISLDSCNPKCTPDSVIVSILV
jgi:hypothetical protein